ncbi:unnamed protein product [Cuscuta epithymum]|uniref:Uncharacterized protein n=2 Tax=Cuscuta epithymum TaxID=186058 RepID=A0AAV0D577_9ASTE|nr:unnamed protein product [Cuscuta epithymum]
MSSAKSQSDQSSCKAAKEFDHFPLCADQISKLLGEGQFVEYYFPQAYAGTNDLLHLKEYDVCMTRLRNSPDGDNSEMPSEKREVDSFWDVDDPFKELDPYVCLASNQPIKSLGSHPIGVEKAAPWWCAIDRETQSSSSSSLESSSYIRNWDLPQFQSKYFGSELHAGLHCVDSSVQMKEATSCNSGHVPIVSKVKAQFPSGVHILSPQGLRQQLSNRNFETANLQTQSGGGSGELSKAQLFEALCHSQTRAREAERMAQQACDEKQHVIDLFFKQASYLFAYRQWHQILQLEILCLQLRNKDQSKSSHIQGPLPFGQFKGRRLKKSQGNRRPARKKQGISRIKLSKCALVFAVGLSLAGAGLFIGWTLGWLFPAF